MTEELMKEIESLDGGKLKQDILISRGFVRNNDDAQFGVYDLYSKKLSDTVEIEVSFLTGEGALFVRVTHCELCVDVYTHIPLLFGNDQHLETFCLCFSN